MSQPPQHQGPPVQQAQLDPRPDCGEDTCQGHGPLAGKTVITGADSGIGRAVAIVNNAAYQMTRESLEETPDEEWDHTIVTNLSAMFHLCKAALPHMESGAAILGSSSVNSDSPNPKLPQWAVPASRLSWLRSTSFSPPTRPAMSPARASQ